MSSFNRRSHGSSSSHKRRRRRPPASYPTNNEEQKFLHQAIQNSKLDRKGTIDIPWGPTFFPTVEEMEGNPLHFIEKIRPTAEKYGIAKIVPPKGWKPPLCVDLNVDKHFSTKNQLLHRLQEGVSFGDGEEYNPTEYQKYASAFTKDYKAKNYPLHEEDLNGKKEDVESDTEDNRRQFCPRNLERDYWEIVETRSREIAVEYGNDVDTHEFGSGFPLSERGRSVHGSTNSEKVDTPEPGFATGDYYKETWWNLNNIPWAPDSVLGHVKVGINGINVPWMYYGSLFTTFCWHNEDNFLYSINYHHRGAPKQWYGIPGTKKDADGLEKVFKNYLSMKMRDVPDLLHHITTMFSPRLLQNAKVPIYKLLQHEGEFVVTFPRAFHGGFSMGPNIGEAVNFATHDWIAHGSDANERYRSFARPSVFSHDRLTFTMAHHLQNQKTYKTCRSLLDELERVVTEELESRASLIQQGVRDVSAEISLPPNRLDQLDEESADYDDKRLCHACKHVCFFSAVACECSQSKVSCLRHSHYMCRCPTERRYLMIWSKETELKATVEKVQNHCDHLKMLESKNSNDGVDSSHGTLPLVAVGVEEDLKLHEGQAISTDPYSGPFYPPKRPSLHDIGSQNHHVSSIPEVTTDEDKNSEEEDQPVVMENTSEEEDRQVVMEKSEEDQQSVIEIEDDDDDSDEVVVLE